MKKHFLLLIALFAASLFVVAEKTIYVYKKDGTKVPYVASTVDSIGFVNVHTITFNANGGTGSMDVVRVKDGESITLSTNEFTYAKAEFAGWNTAANGSGTAYADKGTVKPTANITLYAQWEAPKDTGVADGHEWVDLGLPSGLKWATCNVGANSPEDYGDYFAWGETTPNSSYTSSDYNYSSNPTTLPLSMDAAYTNWGTSWRMPTHAEVKELEDNCTGTWTTQNGVKGYKVTSKTNGNSIFLPAAGYRDGSYLIYAGSYGDYWTSSLYTDSSNYAYYLSFSPDFLSSNLNNRYRGRSVRPVLAE